MTLDANDIEKLKTCFQEVTVSEDRHVVAKSHNKFPVKHACTHERRNVSRNVKAYINKDGYLSTNRDGISFFHKKLVWCMKCEFVLEKE